MPLAVRQTSLNKHSIWVLITRSGIEIYVGNDVGALFPGQDRRPGNMVIKI